MQPVITDIIALLKRTPLVLENLLSDIPDKFIHANEGEGTWSPFDVVGHLLHAEENDWFARVAICLSTDEQHKTFAPVDRFAQLDKNKDKSIYQLLEAFKQERAKSIRLLEEAQITSMQMDYTALHPQLGTVTLAQLLSTWVAHDQDHLYQINRVIAHQYNEAVGPWKSNLRILRVAL